MHKLILLDWRNSIFKYKKRKKKERNCAFYVSGRFCSQLENPCQKRRFCFRFKFGIAALFYLFTIGQQPLQRWVMISISLRLKRNKTLHLCTSSFYTVYKCNIVFVVTAFSLFRICIRNAVCCLRLCYLKQQRRMMQLTSQQAWTNWSNRTKISWFSVSASKVARKAIIRAFLLMQ